MARNWLGNSVIAAVLFVWVAVVSGFLMRRYSAVSAPERAPVPA